jgi:hypothetical protein
MRIYGERLVIISGTIFHENPYGEGGPSVCRRAGGSDAIHMPKRPETCSGDAAASKARIIRGGWLLLVIYLMLVGSFVLMPVCYVKSDVVHNRCVL